MKSSVTALELEEIVEPAPSQSLGVTEMPLVRRDLALFGHVNVRLSVEVGYVDVAIDRLMACKSGDILTLAQDLDAPVTLLVDGKPVALGWLVAVEDNFGVQITEIV